MEGTLDPLMMQGHNMSKVEELFCKVASSKMIEDKAAGMICAAIEKIDPNMTSAECLPLVDAEWAKLVAMVNDAGAWGRLLFMFSTTESQRGTTTSAATVTRVDLDKYHPCFGDSAVFGDVSTYTYPSSTAALQNASFKYRARWTQSRRRIG